MSLARKILSRIFALKMTGPASELLISSSIMNFGLGMIALFEPIYLYQNGYSIPQILLFYFAVYFLYFWLLPLGGKLVQRYGYEHSIFYSMPFTILYYGALAFLPLSPVLIYLAVIFLAVGKALYWPGYLGEFSRYGEGFERGREISGVMVSENVSAILGPVLGGLILTFGNFQVLFFVSSIIVVLSTVPLMKTAEVFLPKFYGYWQSYRTLVDSRMTPFVLANIGFGEEFFGLIMWPTFIYLVVGQSTLFTGSLISVATLIMVLVLLLIGRLDDKVGSIAILKIGSIVATAVWFLRVFVSVPLTVFATDASGRIGKGLTYIPLLSIVYEFGRKFGVMRSAVLFEMSLIVGKLLAIALSWVAFTFWPEVAWKIIFILAGLFVLLYYWGRSIPFMRLIPATYKVPQGNPYFQENVDNKS